MSRKTLLSRPRTRLYDANYNIGESYYKSALDRLDRKYSGRPLSPPPRSTTPFAEDISDRHARIFGDEDIETSRRRASKHIKEQHLFDSRGALIGRRPPFQDGFENDVNEESSMAIRSVRAIKKAAVIDDVDLENTSNNLKSHRLLNRSEKILDSVGINDRALEPRRALEDGSAYRRRAIKSVTFDEGDELQNGIHKWTPVESQVTAVKARREEVTAVRARKEDRSSEIRSESSAAAARARQTKERITDIEEEMAALAEKQAAREARVARLRALVAETEQESEAVDRAQAAAERRSVRREKFEASSS
ncbi:hypothetical protein NQ318_017930 [Aromia moschata]|uniref:Paramyosin n=1 Tax=Aromia moschata TaxID=1265417 RepID=A0AAV8YE83_9CUCU|nr:hypothetical protein NQ318_017930 [Aromia moschata]